MPRYAWLLIGFSVVNVLLWVTLARMKFQFRFRPEGRVFATLRHALGSYGIWDHFNRMVVDTLFTFDVAVLSLVNQRADIASYSIALRLTEPDDAHSAAAVGESAGGVVAVS